MKIRTGRKPQLPPMTPLTVRFPVEDLETMRRLARENHRSLNAEIVHAVAEYIRRQGRDREKLERRESAE